MSSQPNPCPHAAPLSRWSALAALAAALAGCAGGGGDATPSPPPASPLTLSGVAASGAALAAVPVSARCASGSGSSTTAADGSFTLTVPGGSLPCVLKADAASGALVSLALGSGGTATANITPLTHLLLAQAAARDPAAYFESFDAGAAAALSSVLVAAAQNSVKRLLASAGIDLDAVGDWLAGPLVARNGSTSGNAYDLALDTLGTTLAGAGSTLDELTASVVAGAAPDPLETASLPAAMLLQPATPTCAALRSGRYRLLMPQPGATLAAQSGIAIFDAATRTITRPGGDSGTWTANGNCRFTDTGSGWTADVVVAQSGIWAGRYSRDGGTTWQVLLGLPEQAHAVAELAGEWQQMGLSKTTSGTSYSAFTGTTTFDATGTFSAGTECQNDSTWAVDTCTTLTAPLLALLAPLQPNADGGFDIQDAATHGQIGRLFAYRAGGGFLMLAGLGDGGLSLWTPQRPVPLPAVGAVNYNVNLNVAATLGSSGTEASTNTVTSVDTTTGNWTRTQQTLGAAFSYVTTLSANRPRDGLFFRPAGSVIANDGTTTVRLNEFTGLRMHGMGFSPVVIPAPKLLQLSVAVPAP